MQRLRIRFRRGEEVKLISHLDIMRLWQRAFHRAEIALAYSEGFNPRPRISLAAPLPLGVTSEAELMDVFCNKQVSPHWFTGTVSQQLPSGIEILQVYLIDSSQPSLPAQVRLAEYTVEVETEKEPADIEAAITGLLSAKHLPWQHQRDNGPPNYDLKALIDELGLIRRHRPYCTVAMRLCC